MLPLTPHFFARHPLLFFLSYFPHPAMPPEPPSPHGQPAPGPHQLPALFKFSPGLLSQLDGASPRERAAPRLGSGKHKSGSQLLATRPRTAPAAAPRSGKPNLKEQPRPADHACRLRPHPGAGRAVRPGPNSGRGANGEAGLGGTAGRGLGLTSRRPGRGGGAD